MLNLNKFIEEKESNIWNFPNVFIRDTSITDMKLMTVYDDNHGTGDLTNVKDFSYTTDNPDVWLVPNQAYFVATVKLTKADGTAYDPTVDNITIDTNVCNLFSQVRYYLEDKEVEAMEDIGINTLIYNLTKYNETENNAIKYSQLNLYTSKELYDYMKKCHYEIQVIIPMKKLFPFWDETLHAFRGVKHRITLKLNDQNKMIFKSLNAAVAGAAAVLPVDGKVSISKMELRIPQFEPSLQLEARLENTLARQTSFNIKWPAVNVYKFQPPKNADIRVPLSSTIHKPTNVLIAFQNLNKSNDQTHSFMEFDSMSIQKTSVEINSCRFPDQPIETQFTRPWNVHETFTKFLDLCDKGIPWENGFMSYVNFFPIIHIDVSKHKPELYENSIFPNIVVNCKFDAPPAHDYIMWVIIYNIREAVLDFDSKKMRIIK